MTRRGGSSFLLIGILLATAAWADEPERPNQAAPPHRHGKENPAERRDLLLERAQTMRANATRFHERADNMREAGLQDLADNMDDRGDALERRATDLEQQADEIQVPGRFPTAQRHAPAPRGSAGEPVR